MRAINEIIVHCSATPPDWMQGQGVMAKRDEIDRWHKARGWKGIGYHYVIDRDGSVAPGRPVSQIGAHVAGHNRGSIGICLIGGKWPDGRWGLKTDAFANHFTPQQDAALRGLLMELSETHPTIKHIKGHNDYTDKKGCPSFKVANWLKDPPQPPAKPDAPEGPLAGLLRALGGLFRRTTPKKQDAAPRGLVAVPHNGRTIYVMPDFYRRDGIRMPVDLPEALQVAEDMSRELGVTMRLPTREHVDSIYAAADVRLTMPTRGEPRQAMATYRDVDAEIERALAGRAGLISGHKKEILRPAVAGRVTIYGGMKPNGRFWQPRPSSVHGRTYTDYSHGLRLVHDPEDT